MRSKKILFTLRANRCLRVYEQNASNVYRQCGNLRRQETRHKLYILLLNNLQLQGGYEDSFLRDRYANNSRSFLITVNASLHLACRATQGHRFPLRLIYSDTLALWMPKASFEI